MYLPPLNMFYLFIYVVTKITDSLFLLSQLSFFLSLITQITIKDEENKKDTVNEQNRSNKSMSSNEISIHIYG
jgi:hypothetical protein